MSRSFTILAATVLTALPGLAADQATVLSGDHVIQGNLCVGAACLASEGFSRGPLMVKGPRTALGFVDTSTTGPTRDWSIVANDYPAGFSFFGIEDVEGNGIVLRIEPDAPQNALYVSSAGRLGLGTSLPQADIHAVNTLNPTLRLEMSGTLGNPDHSWDLIGNDGTFSLAEVVGTTTMGLPFRVHTGNALYTMTMRNNFIGLGTDFPQKRLHIRVAGEATARIEDVAGTAAPRSLLELINNGRPEIVMTNSDTAANGRSG
ncbi:MAG: hypothetical protein R3D85_17255 [Paracoccaceae bacterium]